MYVFGPKIDPLFLAPSPDQDGGTVFRKLRVRRDARWCAALPEHTMLCPIAREEEAAHQNACARPVEKVTADFRRRPAMAKFWRQNIFFYKSQSGGMSTFNFSQLVNLILLKIKSQLFFTVTWPPTPILPETQGG